MSDTQELIESGVLAKPKVEFLDLLQPGTVHTIRVLESDPKPLYFRVMKARQSDNPFTAHLAKVEWTFRLTPEEREAAKQEWLLDKIADLALEEGT